MCDQPFPSRSPCSGNGVCVTNASRFLCICDDGWTGTADFKPAIQTDCDIHIATINVCYYIAMCWGAFNAVVFFAALLSRLHEAISHNTLNGGAGAALNQNGKLRAILRVPHVVDCFLFSVASILMFLFSLRKVVHGAEGALIGHDLATTVLFSAWQNFYFGGTSLVTYSMTHISPTDKRRIRIADEISPLWFSVFVVNQILVMGAGAMIIAMVYASSPHQKQAFLIAHMLFLTGFGILSFSLLFIFANTLLKLLEKSVHFRSENSASLTIAPERALLTRVRIFRNLALPQAVLHPLAMILFACWPFIRVKHAYAAVMFAFIQLLSVGYAIMLMPWAHVLKLDPERTKKMKTLTESQI